MKKTAPPFITQTTYGMLAIALFSYVMISGILLAIPFDVKSPYTSISRILVMNPWASLIRNLHFWSAQLFFIFSLIHLYDHFHNKAEIGLKKGLGFRLSLGVFIIFLAMLTGFLLKGDADALQARQIIQSLSLGIPLIGKAIALSFLGNNNDYQLIYVHHIATFSIFIAIIILEHSKRIWPRNRDFVISFVFLMIISYFLSAPLHDNLNPSVKGPWYFVGFQEILHWLSHPIWSVVLVAIILVLLYFVNVSKRKLFFLTKRILLILTGIYLLLTLFGLFFRGENWQFIFPGQTGYNYSVLHAFKTERVDFYPNFSDAQLVNAPIIEGRKESCLVCHTQVQGFSEAHNPNAIGCASCHGGNPFATSKNQSHKNMVLIPGNLQDSQQSCGTTNCHADINHRVSTSLMANLSGMISVDRFVFNEQDSPDLLTSVHELGNSAADEHLKNLCVVCHLGNPKVEAGPVNETSRGGGCLACHLNYNEEAEMALNNHNLSASDTTYLNQHATLSIQVTNNHCFGCHSRSGRISTNYEGWHETTLEAAEMPDSSNYRLIEAHRVFVYKGEDVHHKLGLECIDCHHSYELMGDGERYAHQEEMQDVQCIDCHFSGKPALVETKDLDNESAIIAALRFDSISGRKFLKTNKRNHALINTYFSNDSAFLITKNGKQLFHMSPPNAVCTGNKAHENLSCSSCHTAWAPTCIGCHNSFDSTEEGYDMIKNRDKQGSWVEYVGEYNAKLPSLGLRKVNGKKEIIPVIPGMVLTIDQKSFDKNAEDSLLFHRLYAPAAPHTTAAKGRSCISCHARSLALGYGDGDLDFVVREGIGKWVFTPIYAKELHDGLPLDAWTGFLQTRSDKVSTRTNVFPFSVDEQKQILTVGACLSCHKEDSKVMKQSLVNFAELMNNLSDQCVLPSWE